MSKIEARVLTESEYYKWDELVEQSEQGTIFYSSKWISTASQSLRWNYAIIGVFIDTNLIGGCFFYIKNIFYLLKIGDGICPLTPYGGFVILPSKQKGIRESENREHKIISLILEKIQTFNFCVVRLVNWPALSDIRPFKQKGWIVQVNYTYIISLDDDIYSKLGKNIRSSIRKAEKIGIKVKKEYNPDILWKLMNATYDKHNIKIPFQKEYVYSLMEMLIKNNAGEMWIAKMPSGDVISVVFSTYDCHMAHGWLGASDPKYQYTGVVSLIYFEMLKDLKNRGFHSYNLMGGNISYLSNFFSNFNPKLVPYYGIIKLKGMETLFTLFKRLIK